MPVTDKTDGGIGNIEFLGQFYFTQHSRLPQTANFPRIFIGEFCISWNTEFLWMRSGTVMTPGIRFQYLIGPGSEIQMIGVHASRMIAPMQHTQSVRNRLTV